MNAMKPKLYLQIPEPCHENWDNMTPTEQGRHCAACNKQVVDFSVMTDREVLNYFNNRKGDVCGRVFDNQLNIPISLPAEPQKKNWRWLAASIISLLMIQRTEAQRKDTVKGDSIIIDSNREIVAGIMAKASAPVKPIAYKIKGTVKDTNGQPVTGANIYESGKVIAITDSDGKFSFKIQGGNRLKLTASSLSYEDTTVTITNNTNTHNLQIVLREKFNQLNDVTVTSFPVVGKITRTMGSISTVSCSSTDVAIDSANENSILKNNSTEAFKIYPNPVPKNTNVHMVIPEQGNYVAQLVNNRGQMLIQQSITGTTKGSSIEFALPILSAGMYYIRLINQQTRKQYTSKVIVQ